MRHKYADKNDLWAKIWARTESLRMANFGQLAGKNDFRAKIWGKTSSHLEWSISLYLPVKMIFWPKFGLKVQVI